MGQVLSEEGSGMITLTQKETKKRKSEDLNPNEQFARFIHSPKNDEGSGVVFRYRKYRQGAPTW